MLVHHKIVMFVSSAPKYRKWLHLSYETQLRNWCQASMWHILRTYMPMNACQTLEINARLFQIEDWSIHGASCFGLISCTFGFVLDVLVCWFVDKNHIAILWRKEFLDVILSPFLSLNPNCHPTWPSPTVRSTISVAGHSAIRFLCMGDGPLQLTIFPVVAKWCYQCGSAPCWKEQERREVAKDERWFLLLPEAMIRWMGKDEESSVFVMDFLFAKIRKSNWHILY